MLLRATDDVQALCDFSTRVRRREVLVIIGPSGSGKSTFLRCLNGLEEIDSGSIVIDGIPLDDKKENRLEIRKEVGMVFQLFNLFPHLTVLDNVSLAQRLVRKKSKKEASETSMELLRKVGIPEKANTFPNHLSGGQQQRVALARAIALNPEVILYDEPTTGLDPIRSDIINELIIKLQSGLGLTSIVVTHDMKSAYKVGDRIIMLHHGKIIADGDAEHIENHPHPAVQQFIQGQVSEDDLAALRMSGDEFKTQFLPEDFRQ